MSRWILGWELIGFKNARRFWNRIPDCVRSAFLRGSVVWSVQCAIRPYLLFNLERAGFGLAAGLGQDVPSKATFILLELRDKNCVWRHPVDTCISLHGHQIIHKIQHPVQCIIQGKPWQSLMRHKARTGKQPLIYFLKVEAKKRIKEALNRPRIIAIWRLT